MIWQPIKTNQKSATVHFLLHYGILNLQNNANNNQNWFGKRKIKSFKFLGVFINFYYYGSST